MVGRFAGWLIYFPALPNWVSMFQNSTGGSSTTSFTLQDCTFPVAWFSICRKCPSCSIWTILYLGLHLRSHLLGCLFLKYTHISYLKRGWCPVHGLLCSFEAILIQCIFLVMANAESMCFKIQHSRIWILPRIIAWALVADAEVNLDPFHTTKKNGVSAVARLGVTYSWQELDLCIYPSWMGPFHITSSG